MRLDEWPVMDQLRQLEREAAAAAAEMGPGGPGERAALLVILASQIRRQLEEWALAGAGATRNNGDRRHARDANPAVERRRYVAA
jgi:hypothetical protein